MKTIAERLLKYTNTSEDGCWEWVGATGGSGGYGMLSVNGRTQFAHRLMFQIAYQTKLKPKDYVCHKCDNPKCVRPTHLFKGTARDNLIDALNKGRRKTGICKLSIGEQEEIRDMALTHLVEELAEEFGCGVALIYKVLDKRRKTC